MVPIDRNRHAGKAYRQGAGYGFVATQAVVPLVGAELATAAVAMPIGFIDHAGHYLPVAVMSPAQGRNLFVGPNGQWLGLYLPAMLRSYPFRLGRVQGTEQMTVFIDEDSGLIVDAEADGGAARFFESDGSPSAALKATGELLQQIERDRSATELAVAALAEAGLFVPWTFTVKLDGQQVNASGLFRVDEAKLNALDGEAFMKLRKSSSLVLAYAHLISTHTTGRLEQLALIQQQLSQPRQAQPPPLSAIDDGGTIRFN
jgi:hypothetical protein